ncbi:MAG TPA: phosphocholine cytidylyltransferase family protein [Bacteroidota bacterium]|nr:phosphocholine cytidylyltransferase family protein [Bacteroidota bacterium]
MKGVILAAGVSSRLRPLTDLTPKCLLELGGRTILGMTLENLIVNGIVDIVIVTGYREALIRGFVRDAFPALDVEFVRNDRFETTNNIYSLALTERSAGDDGIMLLDSDIVFDRRILGLLAGSGHDTCLAMKRMDMPGDEEIKVTTGPGGEILRIGKDVPPAEAAGESIGIEKLSPEFLKGLYGILGRMMTEERNVNLFYEAAFQEAITRGARMAAVDVGALPCIEIDTPEDLQDALGVKDLLQSNPRR